MKPNDLREAIKRVERKWIGKESQFFENDLLDAVIAAVMVEPHGMGQYKRGGQDYKSRVYRLLQSAKSNQVMEIATSPEVIEGAIQKRIDLLDRTKSTSKESE